MLGLPRRGDVLPWALLTILVGCNSGSKGPQSAATTADPLAQRIHDYLGTNAGNNPTQWKGLVGNIQENNRFLVGELRKINCRLLKLEGQQCPTQPPPPSTRPTDPPKYP